MADASAAVAVRMVITAMFQINVRDHCKWNKGILTEASTVEAKSGSGSGTARCSSSAAASDAGRHSDVAPVHAMAFLR